MTNFSTMITGLPDRENVVFEVFVDSCQVAEISHEPGRGVEIEIYPSPDGGPWKFGFNEFMDILREGAEELR